jgi:ketosteroid isomerase-like protein
MLYQSPADFAAEYAKAHEGEKTDAFGGASTLEEVTVVSQTPDTARVEARWFTYGHAPDAGYYDVFERIAFVLAKRTDGWHLRSEEHLGYE